MDLSTTLRQLRRKSGKSTYQLAKLAGLDQAFLRRVERGEKGASRETIIRVGIALVHNSDAIGLHDVDELLLNAGFAPLTRAR